MPYDDEDPPMVEIPPELNALSHRVIGAAIAVHRELGPGYDEKTYGNALAIEFMRRGISFQREAWIDILYLGEVVGRRRMDFVVEEQLVLENKTVAEITELDRSQAISYLKLTGHKLALLINFNVIILKDGIRRVIRG
ncbi:MAG TPA: GxxExxY protein [Tepidisphaeraceae bacterium]|nr:GxxExxY protein [Tepidisphaeraceae bacterium]